MTNPNFNIDQMINEEIEHAIEEERARNNMDKFEPNIDNMSLKDEGGTDLFSGEVRLVDLSAYKVNNPDAETYRQGKDKEDFRKTVDYRQKFLNCFKDQELTKEECREVMNSFLKETQKEIEECTGIIKPTLNLEVELQLKK